MIELLIMLFSQRFIANQQHIKPQKQNNKLVSYSSHAAFINGKQDQALHIGVYTKGHEDNNISYINPQTTKCVTQKKTYNDLNPHNYFL